LYVSRGSIPDQAIFKAPQTNFGKGHEKKMWSASSNFVCVAHLGSFF
jgi:hypothetical protein